REGGGHTPAETRRTAAATAGVRGPRQDRGAEARRARRSRREAGRDRPGRADAVPGRRREEAPRRAGRPSPRLHARGDGRGRGGAAVASQRAAAAAGAQLRRRGTAVRPPRFHERPDPADGRSGLTDPRHGTVRPVSLKEEAGPWPTTT